MQITIGKLAAAGGVGVETIRYYQRRGLLATVARGAIENNVQRVQTAADIVQRRIFFGTAAYPALGRRQPPL